MRPATASCILFALIASVAASQARASIETLWIEAESLNGIKGSCWPMGKPAAKKTDGHWGLSGPGWASEWVQGGESGFLSIACGADDDKAVATKDIEIPSDGHYRVWVRYRDNREAQEPFQIKLEQSDSAPLSATFGEAARVEEDNEMKLYWGWAFAWDARDADLKKGLAKLTLASGRKASDCRQIDVIVITTDPDYRPLIKDRPRNYAWESLAAAGKSTSSLEPLTRNRIGAGAPASVPDAWKPKTFRDKGFLYLWNIPGEYKWGGDDPNRVLYPYNVGDDATRKEFEAKYGGKKDVPIFSDPRIVPTFLGVGGAKPLQTDAANADVKASAERFVKWLDANPDRLYAMLLNYQPDEKLTPGGVAHFAKYHDRFVGSISGENLGYFELDPKETAAAIAGATTRRQVADALGKVCMTANAAKYRTVFGTEIDQPYRDVIACPSTGMIAEAPLCFDWGARTMGFESAVATYNPIGMRLAFLRGAARQRGGLTATYRSCNFGDSATMFSNTSSYTSPQAILDNYYNVYAGAGMTWYKFDIWYQYMSGTSMFYHEQGFDEFCGPGGTAAAGIQEVQLSPKGKLVDRFLRLTAKDQDFDRGVAYTPAAILVDYAHGWEPTNYDPNLFITSLPPDKAVGEDHKRMMYEYISTAYYPIVPRSQAPITSTSESFVPGVFGDVFDVIYAYPDVSKWTTIDTYPLVIVAGDIDMTEVEGRRLQEYVENGGTLLVADAQLTGPGSAVLKLPRTDTHYAESDAYHWLLGNADDASKVEPSQRFRFKAITADGAKPLATSADGKVFCVAMDVGKGRLIYLSAWRGMGIDKQAVPVLGRLFAHLTSALMPVEVRGDVQWLVNRTEAGWMVTLLNPYGQDKPQHGITPTDYRQNRKITIVSRGSIGSARDRLLPDDKIETKADGQTTRIDLTVPAGGVRIIELK